MKKILTTVLMILAAALIIGVIVFTVMSNLRARDDGKTYIGDGINTTEVPDTTLTANVIHLPFGKGYAKENDFTKFDYITIDLDISPDGINGTYHTEGMKFAISYMDNVSNKDVTLTGFYVFDGGDGHYYLGSSSSKVNVSEEAKLSAKKGVYDHLTFICQINKTEGALSSITTSAYANGNFVAETTKELTGKCSFTRFFIGKAKDQGDFDAGCGISYKNFVGYTYNADGKKATILEHVLATKAPLYNDTTGIVVYNANYETPDANKNYVKINDEKYTLIGKVMDRIATLATGDVITVSGRNLSNVTIPSGVESFTVNLENGGSFALSPESESWYVKDGNTYRFQKKNIAITDDCSTSRYDTSHVLNGDKGTSGTTSLGFAHNNAAKSTHIRVTYVNSSYVRIHYNSANRLTAALGGDTTVEAYLHMECEAELAWRAHNTYSEKTDLKNMKYLTLDFDFGADAYAYTYVKDGKTAYVTAKDDAEFERKTGTAEYESRELAFPQTSADGLLRFTPMFLSSKTDEASSAPLTPYSNPNWDLKSATQLEIRKTGGEWRINPKGSADTSAKLSGEVGVFDHITYVFEITDADGKTTVIPHVYVNGEYLASLPGIEETEGASYNHFHQMRINFGNATREDSNDTTVDNPSYKMYDRYSFAFDNMALTYYDGEDLLRTTLDEKLGEKAPLYTMTGVVYGEDYQTPNFSNKFEN